MKITGSNQLSHPTKFILYKFTLYKYILYKYTLYKFTLQKPTLSTLLLQQPPYALSRTPSQSHPSKYHCTHSTQPSTV